MSKILKVISNCNACQFCKDFKMTENNYTNAFICIYTDEETGEIINYPFLLEVVEYNGKPIIDIPGNCPLETYTPKKDEHQN